MPTSSIEPQDPLQVWECKALQKLGSAEVLQGSVCAVDWELSLHIQPRIACVLQALPLLQRIAKQVQPVMRKRGWRVPLLTEFSPKNPNLLVMSCQILSLRTTVWVATDPCIVRSSAYLIRESKTPSLLPCLVNVCCSLL